MRATFARHEFVSFDDGAEGVPSTFRVAASGQRAVAVLDLEPAKNTILYPPTADGTFYVGLLRRYQMWKKLSNGFR